jgi:hypothetical protein
MRRAPFRSTTERPDASAFASAYLPNRRGTALVPTATSTVSRSSAGVDEMGDLDAHGRIYTQSRPLGAERSPVQIRPPRLIRKPRGSRLSSQCL